MPRYADIVAVRDALYEADAITMKGVRILNQFPTISPDDVRGVGEWSEDRMDYRCSVCGKSVKDEIFYMFEPYQMPPYCPNCGARMKGAEDSE